ncbi:cysteine desulfurase [Candidatus Gottesmanbacteria bacterium]|nr:cysteine desulfurase [Candidatus Gottesmanbacteria bacterium]
MSRYNKDFPQLGRLINGKPIVYLDSAATSLKPQAVIAAMTEYYRRYSANVYRGIYTISEEATEAYEGARKKVAHFIGAPSTDEIIFTRGATESINLVAAGVGKTLIAGDNVVTTIMEHHSNFVPWQQLSKEKNLGFRIWNLGKEGKLDLEELDKIITRRTKVLAITAVSNVLGTINPIKKIVASAKRINTHCLVVVDAAQAVPHMPVDVVDWGADFVGFSGHKMLGPTGIGVLWGKTERLEELTPYQYGGEMISEVHVDKTLFKLPPQKFEAGTPHIAGAIGLGAAIDYLQAIGMDNVRAHEKEITEYALSSLSDLSYLLIIGPKKVEERGGVISFTIDNIHAHDIAQVLDEDNICIRAGHHCAMPLHEHLGLSATARASFYIYTTKEDIDVLVEGLEKVKQLLSK